MSTDVVGRVKRLPLKPSATSALLPMFEAVSNGLHAVEDRHRDKARDQGRIIVEVLRAPADPGAPLPPVVGFVVTDNGVGLNDDNYHSFLRPDSQYKIQRGGKGVGRLGWLKVFKEINVDSSYVSPADPDALAARSFDFVLTEDEQVVLRDGDALPPEPGTRISMRRFDPVYGNKCPLDPAVIRQRIIGHFIQILATDAAPAIVVLDADDTTDLRVAFGDLVKDTSEQVVKIGEEDGNDITLTIRHMRAAKAIRSDANQRNYNWLYLSAHQRAVDEAAIDDAIGLKALGGEDVYVGCVYGSHLDGHVNAERTAFTFDRDENRDIRRALTTSIRGYLDGYVSEMKEKKRATAVRVVEEYPQFLYLQGEMESFVENLPPAAASKEQVFVEMCRNRFRRTNQAHQVEASLKKAESYTEEVATQMDEYRSFVQKQQEGVLAEYVLLRKSVIDILDRYMGFQEEKDANYLEEAIHKLIVPMRADSTRLDIKDHQLWLLDDRLAFFSYFASDKALRSYTSDASLERPDIAFFYDTCFAWREQEAGNTVVLVEFKRPGRDDYDGEENPLRQLIGYIKKFKGSSSLRDARGRTFSPHLKNAVFHCYVVADITDSLRDAFDGYPFHTTPDGEGLVGYLRSPDAFVEVISYSKLLRDAKMRNAIFFQKLGITDVAQAAPVNKDGMMAAADDVLRSAVEIEPDSTDDMTAIWPASRRD